jgi:hypothetical protein
VQFDASSTAVWVFILTAWCVSPTNEFNNNAKQQLYLAVFIVCETDHCCMWNFTVSPSSTMVFVFILKTLQHCGSIHVIMLNKTCCYHPMVGVGIKLP